MVYCDVRIDDGVVQSHFEVAYKDEEYFLRNRRAVFEEIVAGIDDAAPVGGAVIDIGGGKGHLMNWLKERRSDLRVVVNDVSSVACEWARSKYGLEVLECRAADLEGYEGRFDVAVALDVIYYEPDIARLWRGLGGLVENGGTVILRVPNTWWLIRMGQGFRNFWSTAKKREMATRIVGFNPEHLFVFRREYLVSKLTSLGFSDVEVKPSPLPLTGGAMRGASSLYVSVARLLHRVSRGRVVTTPSMIVVGRKRHAVGSARQLVSS